MDFSTTKDTDLLVDYVLHSMMSMSFESNHYVIDSSSSSLLADARLPSLQLARPRPYQRKRDQLVIIMTHQLQYLSRASKVSVLLEAVFADIIDKTGHSSAMDYKIEKKL